LPIGRTNLSTGLRKLPSNTAARLVLRFGRMMAMSKTTPADLAVAFRSLVRRRDEAIDAAEGAPVGGLLTELDRTIASAAAIVRSAPSPDAVAAAIGARRFEEWDTDTLEELRRLATEAGTTERRIAESGPDEA
jgi:hypothetical protein